MPTLNRLFKDLNNLHAADAQIILLFDWGRVNGDKGTLGMTANWHYVLYKNGEFRSENEVRVDIWHWGKLSHVGESNNKTVVSLADFAAGLKDFFIFH